MSVELDVNVERLPWRQGVVGVWRGSDSITHDGTGGFARINIIFHVAGDPLGALLYSLESITLFQTGIATDVTATLVTANLGYLRGGATPSGNFVWQRTFVLRAASTTSTSVITSEAAEACRGAILGVPLTSAGESRLAFQLPNTDGDLSTMVALGYVWDQRALTGPEGPRRPVNGIFRD